MADIVQKENLLVRMQADIRRALEKPEGERRWGMVIDTRKCGGCHACTLSCVAENKLPPGVVYRPVLDLLIEAILAYLIENDASR